MQHKVLSLKNSQYKHNTKVDEMPSKAVKLLYTSGEASHQNWLPLCVKVCFTMMSVGESSWKPNAFQLHALTHYMHIQWSQLRTLNSQENTVVHATPFNSFLLNCKLYCQHQKSKLTPFLLSKVPVNWLDLLQCLWCVVWKTCNLCYRCLFYSSVPFMMLSLSKCLRRFISSIEL